MDVEGIHYLCANARDAAYYSHDGQAHQASEGMGIPCAEIEIVPAGSVIPSLGVAEDLQIVIPEIGILEPPQIVDGLQIVIPEAIVIDSPAEEDDMQIVVDGSGVIEGPLPVIFYALTDSSGRFYPLNGGSEHNTLFGLYDSGATSLFINGLKPKIVERNDGQRELLNGNSVGGVNWEDSDAGHLNVSTGERVNIRLTGVQTQQGNRNPPVRTPGWPDGAQVEVSNLIVKKEDGLNVTLVGAPVINQLVAHLDYTNLADSSWLAYVNQSFHVGVDTPSIDLFWPGDPGIPASDLRCRWNHSAW